MKQIFRQVMILFLTILFSQQLTAQTFSGNDGALRFFELKDNEGGLIKTASEMGVAGNPMLLPDWAFGIIRFQSGKVFADSAMNLSLFNHQLFVKRDNRFFEIVQPVSTVTFRTHDENGTEITHTFKNEFPNINGHDAGTMYEVLFEGENLQLLSWEYKKVIDVFNYGGPREKQYTLIKQFYIFLPKENTMTALNSYTIPALKKILPAYADTIQAYCISHNINTKDKTKVLDVLAYLNTKHG